jgi:hypothetical protein
MEETATKTRKDKRKAKTSYFGSWNSQGKLGLDLRAQKIAVCGLQEIMNEKIGETRLANGDLFIFSVSKKMDISQLHGSQG